MTLSTTSPILQLKNVAVSRSQAFQLRVQDLHVASGEVVCLAGANGSGKTSLIEAIIGLIKPQSGTITVGSSGVDPESLEARLITGFIPDDDGWIVPELTASEYFQLLATLYSKRIAVSDALKNVDTLALQLMFTNNRVQLGTLSHGNKKKVQLIAALMHDPELIIIDELRNGLDPIAAKQAEMIIQSRAKSGAAVLAATHDLWWAERLSDRIIMLQDGRVVYQASTAQIVKASGSVEAKFFEMYDAGKPKS